MTILATVVEDGLDIEVGPAMNPVARAILNELHGNCPSGKLECREHDDDPAFAHFRDERGRVHGAYLYVQQRRANWVLCHQPSNRDEFKLPAHEVPIGMSDQHRWQQDYWCRAADAAGYNADAEVPIDGTRLDVLIQGDVIVGAEVQHSGITARKAINRTRKANTAGITCVWSADHKDPPFAFRVPHVETNELPNGQRPRGTWTVTTGPRLLIPKACSPANFNRCPNTRRGVYCGKYHPTFVPMPHVVVDDLAERLPAGDLVPVDTHTKQGVVLLTRDHRELWLHEFADQYPAPKPKQRSAASPCRYDATDQIGHANPTVCARCGQPLLLRRPERELCARCDTAFERLLRTSRQLDQQEGGARN